VTKLVFQPLIKAPLYLFMLHRAFRLRAIDPFLDFLEHKKVVLDIFEARVVRQRVQER